MDFIDRFSLTEQEFTDFHQDLMSNNRVKFRDHGIGTTIYYREYKVYDDINKVINHFITTTFKSI